MVNGKIYSKIKAIFSSWFTILWCQTLGGMSYPVPLPRYGHR